MQAGVEIFRAYAGTTRRQVLLCTDLHGDNVLAAQREPWLTIDPKPYRGDPAYDATQHRLNCMERVEADSHAFCQRMAALLDVDRERVRTWLFARCIEAAFWDAGSAQRAGSIAARLAP